MAAEELNKPPYPQMILSAIEALNEKDGSSEASISKYMESTHTELPASHAALLSQHLNRMRETGQLIFSQNIYKKPDQNAAGATALPQKRGRGRPPKPKAPLQPGTILPPPRPRGRPPKDPNAPPQPKKPKMATGSGRPRGRPRKLPRPSGGGGGGVVPSGRPRGRPPKVRANLTEVSVEQH